jgi:autotransporter-associated beta strand protein
MVMSRKSIRTALCFLLAVIASVSLTGSSMAQAKKVFDNSSVIGAGSELYGDRSNWIENGWAGSFAPIGNDIPAGQGNTNDLGFFGNPSTLVDGPITIRTDVYNSLSLGGWSFNSTSTAYSIQAVGTGSFMNVTLNGVNILTSNGEVSGAGNRILVVSDASSHDVVIGGGGVGFQTLNLTLGVSQGEIYVKSGRSMTIGSSIAGIDRGITKTGSGVLLLSGQNTYTGETIVNAGTLRVSANDRLASGALTIDGSTAVFDIQGFSDSVGAVSLRGNGTLSGTGTLTGTSYAFESGTASLNLAGASAVLTKTTGGTVTLSGANSYTGGTIVTGGTLALGGSNVLADSGAVTVNGGTLAIAGNSDTVGVVTLTSGSITGSGGTLTGSSYALASGNISANLGGSGTVTKTTAGLVTLSGTSSTVGAVNVSGGTLELATGAALNAGLVTVSNAATLDIDGTLTAPTGVNVNAGGTLEGAGTIAGNVNLDGILAPGNSPGTLSINGNLNLTSSSVLNFELNETNTVAGSNINDLVAITGDLVLDGTLNVPDASTPLTWTTSGTDLAPIKWTLFTFTGTLTNNGLTLGSLPTLLSGNSIPQLWQLNIVQNGGGGGSVNLQAVPEPSAALMVGGILAGAACLRRRRVA